MKEKIYNQIILKLEEHKKILLKELNEDLLVFSHQVEKHLKTNKGYDKRKCNCYCCSKILVCQKNINLTINEVKDIEQRIAIIDSEK